jgi:hypothetical protein
MELHDWSKIRNQFKTTLLLGNGASIAVDNRLSYKSLYNQVCNGKKLNSEILSMFDYFKTSNFEFIMRLLLQTSLVNRAINIEDDKSKEYYNLLRTTLIDTIRSIHPSYQEVKPYFTKMGEFLSNFKTVISLNYDLLVYWAMLAENERLNCSWFKDCFVEGVFRKDFMYLYFPQPPAKGSTLVFYPHGNLFLASDLFGNEFKLSRTSDDYLLETVLSKWEEKDYLPLFVSEGTSREKFRSITRSNYLNSVYESILSRRQGSIVIYGWSASEQDEHIFEALDHTGVTDIAISVHVENPEHESYCDMVEYRLRHTQHLKQAKLYFFDSRSEGCWIY